MNLILIAAVADNGVIGKNGTIPWHISEDFKRFKKLTMGHPVIMGRLTYESIVNRINKPLSNRTNIVVSKTMNFSEGIIVCPTIGAALIEAEKYDSRETYAIGGRRIYEGVISLAKKLEITHVHLEPIGDTYFPEIDTKIWKESNREEHKGKINFDFATYERNETRKTNCF